MRRQLRETLPPLLVLAAAITVWYLVSYVMLDADRRFLFPPPHRVIRVGYLDAANRAELLGGLRISAGMSVIGVNVGDFFFRQGEPGIGVLIDQDQSRLQSEQLLAAVILSSLFGYAIFPAFTALARKVVGAWHESTRHPGSNA